MSVDVEDWYHRRRVTSLHPNPGGHAGPVVPAVALLASTRPLADRPAHFPVPAIQGAPGDVLPARPPLAALPPAHGLPHGPRPFLQHHVGPPRPQRALPRVFRPEAARHGRDVSLAPRFWVPRTVLSNSKPASPHMTLKGVRSRSAWSGRPRAISIFATNVVA